MATETQYRPTRTRGTPTEDGDFVVFESVPVFDAHEGDDGVIYDERLLRAIAENCNRRIRDTGDWCPIVVAHTRDEDNKTHVNDDPPVIGLAGPFYVSTFGQESGRPCIFCHFWIFPEHEKDFRNNPRRSVEIWPEERPEDRYFDPIALLGAETPKRDLGMIYSRPRTPGSVPQRYCAPGPMRYSKRKSGQQLKYQEVSSTPGGGNTFIPGSVSRPKRHDKGESMPLETPSLSQVDIQQIVEAMTPVIDAKIAMATSVVEDTEPEMDMEDPSLAGPEADPMGAPPIDPMAAAPPMEPEMGGIDPGMEEDMAGGPEDFGGMELTDELPDEGDLGGELDDEMPMDEGLPPEAGGEDELDLDEDDQLYARGLGRQYMKYAMGASASPGSGGLSAALSGSPTLSSPYAKCDQYMNGLDDEDKEMLGKYFKYMCDDQDEKDKYSARYAKSPLPGDDLTEKPGDSSPSGSMNEDEMSDGKATAPQKNRKGRKPTVQLYQKTVKERDGLKTKYSKLVRENTSLRNRYAKLQAAKDLQDDEVAEHQKAAQYSKREAELMRLESQGFVFNPEDELDLTNDFTDEQFERHVSEVIPTRYAKVTGDFNVPVDAMARNKRKPSKTDNDNAIAEEQHAEQATKAVLRYRESGRPITYKKVLGNLIDNKGEINETTLFAGVNGNGKA